MFAALPELVGGSADLTGSNNTLAKGTEDFTPENRTWPLHPLRRARARHGGGDERHGAARRRHALWRHVPRSFADYSRPADPPGGAHGRARDPRDDARFHRPGRRRPDAPAGRAPRRAARDPQPLRLPSGDAVEAAECWQLALLRDNGPSVLALSRQATPALRGDASANLSARGAYELLPAEGGESERRADRHRHGSRARRQSA
jgi:transketolase